MSLKADLQETSKEANNCENRTSFIQTKVSCRIGRPNVGFFTSCCCKPTTTTTTTTTTTSPVNAQSQLPTLAINNLQQEASSVDDGLNNSDCDLDEVKENFILFFGHNKLQYFYLGTLIYSVMNICFISYLTDWEVLEAKKTERNNEASWEACENSGKRLLLTLDLGQARLALLLLIVPLSFALCFLLVQSRLEFSRRMMKANVDDDAHDDDARAVSELQLDARRRVARSSKLLNSTGLLLVMSLLWLPELLRPQPTTDRCESSASGGYHQYLIGARNFAPLLALIYLQPSLLEGQTGGKTLSLLSLLALLGFLASCWPSIKSDSLMPLLGVPFALLLGLVRRWSFVKTVTERTFAGASQLIEAKVSLEHQRQQQETLLLSVLPAYVAEQVKRNMLKKTTQSSCSVKLINHSTVGVSLDEQHVESQPVTSTQHHRASISVKSRANSLSAVGEQLNEQVLVGGKQVSNCRLWRHLQLNKHSLELTAGGQRGLLAHILRQPSSAGSLENQPRLELAQQLADQSALVQPPGGLQLGGQPSQTRRGFNELYIRTYNNVSLLYGDIVGFTKLCTKLSSSQLVRVLNDLFSHFDHLAEKHKIMRIKILGDCYYGVSGIPEFAVMGAKSRTNRDDNHAINCVNMGLDMIRYIRSLNVERASSSSSSSPSCEHSLEANSTASIRQAEQVESTQLPHFELNMRIGIHTGHIHSGVIGLKKWQFDIWSNDVSIAMHCESSGSAGRVQVTQATVQQLNGEFNFERANAPERDSFLASNGIQTYLIREKNTPTSCLSVSEDRSTVGTTTSRRRNNKEQRMDEASRSRRRMVGADEDNIRKATIDTIRQTLIGAESGDSGLPANKLSLISLAHHNLTPLGLKYCETKLEKLYSLRPINDLFSSLASIFLLLVLLLPGLDLILDRHFHVHIYMIASFVAFLLLIHLCQRSSTMDSQTLNCPTPVSLLDNPFSFDHSEPKLSRRCSIMNSLRRISSRIFDRSRTGLRSASLILIFTIVIVLQSHLIASSQCRDGSAQRGANNNNNNRNNLDGQQHQLTVIILLIFVDLSCSLLSYPTRSMMILVIIVFHVSFMVFQSNQKIQDFVCQSTAPRNSLQVVDWSSEGLLLVVALWAFVYARQLEYASKVNFLWRNRLNVDHEELEYISGINKVLLENILPSHVVHHYLTQPQELPKDQSTKTVMRMSFSNMRNLSNELYHEQHESVAVMFASIPHFYEFYDESDISKQGLGCIALLNEIICDFDKLLLKNKFSRIEKIKTIGSTYMAAAGLRPASLSGARNSAVSQTSQLYPQRSGAQLNLTPSESASPALSPSGGETEERKTVMSQQKLNLICLCQFATNLMTALNGINKQSFQVFKLRIGINTGPVIAGIIGAQRPFYDIWGDCVNIASRMESLGEVGRIQVEERTAKLLMESPAAEAYSVIKRGTIEVKGKGGMTTYFVDKKIASLTDGSIDLQRTSLQRPISRLGQFEAELEEEKSETTEDTKKLLKSSARDS